VATEAAHCRGVSRHPRHLWHTCSFFGRAWPSKPDPEAFRHLATHLGYAPEEVFYFDDDATYVAGAREAGLLAHCVGGAADVRTALATANVTVLASSSGEENALAHET
jgi:beta-phosphoglucomutase-like phosphatase (HAD superfamily)